MFTSEQEVRLSRLAQELLDNGQAIPAAEKLLQLRDVLRYADWKYYVQDNPVLADVDYDRLFALLKTLESQHPELITPDSPTQRVAQGLSEKFPTVTHWVPMLSLENSYNPDDLRDWDRRCRNLLKVDSILYTVEPKFDGAGISLIYEHDRLQRGATRGDGLQGEDITPNIRQIRSVPLSASMSEQQVERLEIRGEVLIPKAVFATYNAGRLAKGLPPLANPRNAASGTLRMLDPEEVRKRGLRAIVYHVSFHQNAEGLADHEVLSGHYETLEWLHSKGFATPVKDMRRCRDIEEVIAYCEAFETRRDDLPYEIDGMVVKVNRIAQQEQLGMTTHHPRWAMAFKFKARQATSVLERVDFQVGRTGAVTPVAKVRPVAIGGVTVSSVSLFNEDSIREKDIRVGDTVLVERAGDVIPYIVKSMPEMRDGTEVPVRYPAHCPVCSTLLEKPEGEAAWRCNNINCPAQVVEHLIHFASKNAMDIRNLGAANIRRFYELGLLKTIPDIYALDFEKIRQLPSMGEKSVENLKAAIENSKKQSLHRLIFGLGIRFVGATTAKTLAGSVAHLLDLENRDAAALEQLEDVGPKVAASVQEFFSTPANLSMLRRLEALGLQLQPDKKALAEEGGKFADKTFLFTGTLTHFKRSDAEEQVVAEGGKLLSGVSSRLDFLIVGEAAGSKLEKAKKLGTVTILSEAEFLELLDDPTPEQPDV